MKSDKKTSADNSAASRSVDTQVSLGAGMTTQSERGPDGPKRPPRIPLHSGKNLYVDESLLDRTRYAYRWFAENSIKGGRVESAKGAWWEHVTDAVGTIFKRPSGQDQMFLMKIEIEYYKEDQELKRKRSFATMSKETGVGDGEYAPTPGGKPEGGSSSITRTAS